MRSSARPLPSVCATNAELHSQRADGAQERRVTSREAEVLQLIAEGVPNKQIAAELAISIKTVEKPPTGHE